MMARSNLKLWLLRFSVRRPGIILGIAGLAVISSALFIPRVRLKLDASSLVPTGSPELLNSSKAADLFALRDVVVIVVVNKNSCIYNPATLKRVIRLSEALGRLEGVVFKSVASLATTPTFSRDGGNIDIQPLLPENEDFNPESIRRIQNQIESNSLDDGVLAASDRSAAAIYAEVEPKADRYQLLSRVRELARQEEDSEDSIYISGTALAQAILGQSAAFDLLRLIPAVIIVLGAVLILAFRSLAPALISLCEIGASLILTIGLMGILKQSVFVTTLVLPVILIAVGVSDDVYAFTHYFKKAESARDRGVRDVVTEAFAGILRPISLTAISTVVGLLSLAATSLEPLRVFGIFGAVAILFSSLFTFTLVPALLVLLQPRASGRTHRRTHRDRAMLRLVYGFNAVQPRTLLLIGFAAAIVAGLLAARVNVDDSWIKNLPETSDIARGDGLLNNLLAGTTTVELMLDSHEHDGFIEPRNLATLGALEESSAAIHSVGAVHGIFADIVRVNAALRHLDYRELRNELLRGDASLTREEIQQALFLMLSARRAPQVGRFAYGFERARMTVFVRSANYDRIERVLSGASAAAGNIPNARIEITPFGDGWISYLTVRLLVRGQVSSIVFALLIDLLLLSVIFKSVRSGLTAILPVAFSVLVVFAVLTVMKVPLGIANSMFAGVAIGIGLDFSIHLTTAFHDGLFRGLRTSESLLRAVVSTGPAIITSAIAISAGFAVLALSTVTPNVQLGLMISLSLIVCAGATLLFVPSLALLRRRKG